MLPSKILFPLLLASSLLALNTNVCAQKMNGFKGGTYVELEPFVVKVRDGLSDFHLAHGLSSSNGDDFCLDDKDKWQFGFHVALGYDFPSCTPSYWGASLEYTYLNFDQNKTRRNFREGPDIGLTSVFSDFTFLDADADLDTTYYTIDLLAHYHLGSCHCFQPKIFGGFRYVKLEDKLHAHFDLLPDSMLEGISRDLDTVLDRTFKGIGPEIGVGIFLPVVCGFGVTGQLAGSVLHGDQHHHLREHFVESLLGATQFDSDDNDHHRRDHRDWVSNISAHVGIGYQTRFYSCSCLMLEIGYRYDRYFNVLDGENFPDCCGGCDCDDHHEHHGHDDFEFHGPYLKLSWHL